MNNVQNNKYRMYHSVETILNDNLSIWSSHKAFIAAVTPFKTNNESIVKLSKNQGLDTTGYTSQRDAIKHLMADLALEVSGAIAAYASLKKDEALGVKSTFSYSELFYVTDKVANNRAAIVYDIAIALGTDLNDYIDATRISALSNAIQTFKTSDSSKVSAKEATQSSTVLLPPLFDSNDQILNDQLDKLMPQFKNDHPEFYSTYFSAREIIDLGSRTTKSVQPTPVTTETLSYT